MMFIMKMITYKKKIKMRQILIWNIVKIIHNQTEHQFLMKIIIKKG